MRLKAGAIERMHRRVTTRSRARAVVTTLVVALALGGLFGCPATTTVNASLISGIFIVPGELDPSGDLGCGTEPTQLYKYVAVVINDARDIAGAGIFDCFAEGVFGNLPGTDAGSLNYGVWIYAYNYDAFTAANSDPKNPNALTNAVAFLNGVYQADGSVVTVPYNLVPDGGTTKRGYPAALDTVCLSSATWVTTCSATAQASVQTLANCTPLTLETSVPSSCSLPVRIPVDGGLDAAVDAPVDATTQDAAHDATMHDAGPQLLRDAFTTYMGPDSGGWQIVQGGSSSCAGVVWQHSGSVQPPAGLGCTSLDAGVTCCPTMVTP